MDFNVGFGTIDILPDSGIRQLRQANGLLVTGRDRESYIRGRLTTGKLLQPEWAVLVSRLITAVEKNERFDLVLGRFRRPRDYVGLAWPLVSVPTIEAVTDRYTISVAGLELGMTLREGDRFTLHHGDLRCHRIINADVEVESITAQAIPFVPRLPIGVFAAADEVHFIDPMIRLAIVAETLNLPESYEATPLSFDVTESLA